MPSSPQTSTLEDTLRILEKEHITLLKETLHKYKDLNLVYPSVPFSSLVPPFSNITSEHPHFPCHINVLLWDRYSINKYDKHFPIKRRLTNKLAHDLCDDRASSIVGKEGFSQLYKAICTSESEDGASIIALSGKQDTPRLIYIRAHINGDAALSLRRLRKQLISHGIKIKRSDFKNDDDYYRIKEQLPDKLYETVGQRNAGGQKHLAAACILKNLKRDGFVIDIMSTTGMFTRISRNDKSPRVRHIMLQPKRNMELESKTQSAVQAIKIPAEYLIDMSYVLFAVEYRRNDTYDLQKPWMEIASEAILHPEDLGKSLPITFLRNATFAKGA